MKNDKKQSSNNTFIIIAIVVLVAILGAGASIATVVMNNNNSTPVSTPVPEPMRPGMEDKPIIYIYPEKETEVEVKLGAPERITVDYPNYNDGWKVVAQPNGTLSMNGKDYYALYYEAKYDDVAEASDGFVVARDDVEEFLDTKLELLGLNYKEREEFITYWAKDLERTDYAFIRFASQDEIEAMMPLEVFPAPKTMIRVMMQYRNLNECIEVTEQKLAPVKRDGYTVVEWGGMKLN